MGKADHDKVHHITVAIGTFSNRNEILDEYGVTSVLKSDYPAESFDIVVVDNNNDDEINGELAERFKDREKVNLVREDIPGICRVRNKGALSATGDIVAFIDDDCEVDGGWLARMSAFYRDPKIMFGGGAIYDTMTTRFLRDRREDPKWPEERRIPGGNMSFRRSLFDRFRFDDNILYGVDDFELIVRLLMEGCEWYFDDEYILHHRAPSKYRGKVPALNKAGTDEGKRSERYFALKREIYKRVLWSMDLGWEVLREIEVKECNKKRGYFNPFYDEWEQELFMLALERVGEDMDLLFGGKTWREGAVSR